MTSKPTPQAGKKEIKAWAIVYRGKILSDSYGLAVFCKEKDALFDKIAWDMEKKLKVIPIKIIL